MMAAVESGQGDRSFAGPVGSDRLGQGPASAVGGNWPADGPGTVTGRVHSVQSLGAVDGPGLRSVVFLQGCPLRCAYCHNPDTWESSGGTEMEAGELVKKLLRFRPYWGQSAEAGEDTPGLKHEEPDGSMCVLGTDKPGGGAGSRQSRNVTGGVTISGGEPLMQPEFVAEVFGRLHAAGVHTALDTSGTGNAAAARKVLAETDLALVDLKFLTEEEYRNFCRGSLSRVREFLALTAELHVPVWIRHVAVPGLTADPRYLRRVKQEAESLPNLQKLEFLPFHNMCMEKYERMGIPFPLKDTRVMEEGEWEKLLEKI